MYNWKSRIPPISPESDPITMELTMQCLRVYPGEISTGRIYDILKKDV